MTRCVEIKNKARLLKKGIDGVIITNIDIIKEKISLILGVADCAAICISHQNGKSMGLVHAGWQGISTNIIKNTIDQLRNLDDIESFKFYIGPMAGKNFEFETDKYYEIFKNVCEENGLDIEKYVTKKENDHSDIDLRSIIKDSFINMGINQESIVFSEIDTNSQDNNWPSYRQDKTDRRIGVFVENYK